jgi:phosphoglucosamine mutase
LSAGAASGGASVFDLGVLPTPGVAALAGKFRASTAAVVSASHNPYPDNGIKFLSGEGRKLPDAKEKELERLLSGENTGRPVGREIGTVEAMPDAARLYAEHVLSRLRPCAEGMKVLLDCAHGAAYAVAPLAFRELGVKLSVVGNEPTGTNINAGVGSTYVDKLAEKLRTKAAQDYYDVAFAFDGDADRVLAVDEKGRVIDGDRIIAILARDLKERDTLMNGVVFTVMSNLGLFKTMDRLGIRYEVTPVGDRYVMEAMVRREASLGGEQSGHVIHAEYATTGDGLVTAFALLDVMARSGKPLSELAEVMEAYPQTLINVAVKEPASAARAASSGLVKAAVAHAESRLADKGRILLRPSGTEPVVRVMVEHSDEVVCREVCEDVAEAVSSSVLPNSPEART